MHTTETKIVVQYYETDQMGIVHHSNYIRYYETARTDFIKSFGISFKQLEDEGTSMPVIDVRLKYLLPAIYDEVLTIKTTLKEIPTSRIHFYYQMYNAAGKLINEAEVILAFLNKATQRPRRAPQQLVEKLSPLINR